MAAEDFAGALASSIPYGSLALGLYQAIRGSQGLKRLRNQPDIKYSEAPEVTTARARANRMSESGFTPQENAAWQQGLNRAQNTAYQHAITTAPNLGREINAGLNYTNVNAINTHAMGDAALHRQNIKYADTFTQHLQNLNNMNIAQQIKNRQMATQAMGMAAQTGLTNTAGALNLGQALASIKTQGINNNPNVNPTTGLPVTTTQTSSVPNMNGAPNNPLLSEYMRQYVSPFTQPPDYSPYSEDNMLRTGQ